MDNGLLLSMDALTQSKMVEKGETTYDAIAEANRKYWKFVESIEEEWPPKRIAEWMLEQERRHYKFYRKRRGEVELENRDARQRGMSYKERQKYARQLVALDRLMVQSEENGKRLAWDLQTGFVVTMARLFIGPLDVDFIHSRGFEAHLKYATM